MESNGFPGNPNGFPKCLLTKPPPSRERFSNHFKLIFTFQVFHLYAVPLIEQGVRAEKVQEISSESMNYALTLLDFFIDQREALEQVRSLLLR